MKTKRRLISLLIVCSMIISCFVVSPQTVLAASKSKHWDINYATLAKTSVKCSYGSCVEATTAKKGWWFWCKTPTTTYTFSNNVRKGRGCDIVVMVQVWEKKYRCWSNWQSIGLRQGQTAQISFTESAKKLRFKCFAARGVARYSDGYLRIAANDGNFNRGYLGY